MKVSQLPWEPTIQTFDDKSEKKDSLSRIMRYDAKRLEELNNLGAGIYWVINPQETFTSRGVRQTTKFVCFGLDCDVSKETDPKKGNVRLNEEEISDRKLELFNKLVELSAP